MGSGLIMYAARPKAAAKDIVKSAMDCWSADTGRVARCMFGAIFDARGPACCGYVGGVMAI